MVCSVRELGHSSSVVYRGLIRHGVELRSIGDSLRRNDVDSDLIRRLHTAGVRSKRIARALGVSSWLVDQRVREMGLTPYGTRRPTSAEIESANLALEGLGLNA